MQRVLVGAPALVIRSCSVACMSTMKLTPKSTPRKYPVDTEAVQNIFHKYDRNNDGRLTVEEFTNVLQRLNCTPRVVHTGTFSARSYNIGSCYLHIHSIERYCMYFYVTSHVFIATGVGINKTVDDTAIVNLFKRIDADNDGYLNLDEFVQGLLRLNIAPRKLVPFTFAL